MLAGAILDNVQTGQGQQVPESSYRKIRTMGARHVGLLWTGGTRHGRDVYERCEAMLDRPQYTVRVGGHRQTVDEWLDWLQAVITEVPDHILAEGRIQFTIGNEPNLEGWRDDPGDYGALYRDLRSRALSVPVLFACPSMGGLLWEVWMDVAYEATGNNIDRLIVNLYDHNVSRIAWFTRLARETWVGEVNRLARPRVDWLNGAMQMLANNKVAGALVFIAGGVTSGQGEGEWDAGYIISEEEAAGLRGEYEGKSMLTWKLAFEPYARAHPEVGTPEEDIAYDDHGNAWQHGTGGLLFSHKADGWRIYWFPRPKA